MVVRSPVRVRFLRFFWIFVLKFFLFSHKKDFAIQNFYTFSKRRLKAAVPTRSKRLLWNKLRSLPMYTFSLSKRVKIFSYELFHCVVMGNFYVVTRVIPATYLSGQGTRHFKRGHPYVITFYIGLLEYLSCSHSFTWVELKHSFNNSARISI